MRNLRTSLTLIRQHRRTFIAMNIAYFGVLAAFLVAATLVPGLHQAALARADAQVETGFIAAVSDAYVSGHLPLAASLTLATNLIVGALCTLTVPSLVVPFFGVAFALYRAAEWGMLFAPVGSDAVSLLPHYLTLVLEGLGYVIAASAVWLHGRMFLQPRRFGFPSHRSGFVGGLRATLRLYPLVIAVLLVAAVYEAFEVIHLVPLLAQ